MATITQSEQRSIIRTLAYVALEVHQRNSQLDYEKADIYSLGLTIL